MLENVTIKMPTKMKKALIKLAEREFSSVSGILKNLLSYILKKTVSTGARKMTNRDVK